MIVRMTEWLGRATEREWDKKGARDEENREEG